ncbi:unnamed protein product [Scytosiphon promiscuus]
MRVPKLHVLVSVALSPAASFILNPIHPLQIGTRGCEQITNAARGREHATDRRWRREGTFSSEPAATTPMHGEVEHQQRVSLRHVGTVRPIPRGFKTQQQARGSDETLPAPTVSGRPAPHLHKEAVSCLQNKSTGYIVWLVGIIHEDGPYVQLVKGMIREIKPQVVMLELDAESIYLLPPGTANQDEGGLCWWRPVQQQLEAPKPRGFGAAKPTGKGKSKRKAKAKKKVFDDVNVQVSEIWTAGREALSCGARVLLGDRSDKVSKEREAEANVADSDMLTEVENTSEIEWKKIQRARKGLKKLADLVERRRAHGFEMPETRAIVRKHSEWDRLMGPKSFDVVVTERDEVMAKTLMALDETADQGTNLTTVAVVGSAHLDGMEDIFVENGWALRVPGEMVPDR